MNDPIREPEAFYRGEFLPASALCVSPADMGFVLGVTVSEQLRTFAGELFRWEEHLARLRRSLAVVGVTLPLDDAELTRVADRLVRNNFSLLPKGGDLGLAVWVTPGTYPTFAASDDGPTICLHTYPLPFDRWYRDYEAGVSLVITKTRQVPPDCWPPHLKCRSRMHYYLAEQEATSRQPGAKALLLSEEGYIRETATANVVACVEQNGRPLLLSPPQAFILPGISLATVQHLAEQLGWSFAERELQPNRLASAEEVWLTSTPWCMLPVTQLDTHPIGTGQPGCRYREMLAAWSDLSGIDIADQARKIGD